MRISGAIRRLRLIALAALSTLTCAAQTRSVQIVNATNAAGDFASVSIQLVSLGNENGAGFSLGFDTNLLAFRSVARGAGAAGFLLDVNTNQVSNGRVGIALAAPAGQTFQTGTDELARVQFQVGGAPGIANLALGDQPIVREAVNTNADVLTTLYVNGAITITPLLKPTILTNPASQTIQPVLNAPTNATFSVVAAGSAPLRYQWRWYGTNLAGATTNNLTLTNVLANVAGAYDVVVTNAGGSVTSAPATLSVLPALIPPALLVAPRSQVVSTGETVTFTAQANGSAPLNYQWRWNGADLSGRTNSSLILTNIATTQAGAYAVRVSNGGGNTNSPAASLTVNPYPRTVRVVSQNVASGASFDLVLELTSFGDENALGFTLQFDPSRLQYQSSALAAGGAAGFLNLNTNQLANGRLGIALALAPGNSFAAGVSTFLTARFIAGSVPGSNYVSFGDSPILRQLADANGNARPSAFQPGYVDVLSTAPSLVSSPASQTLSIFSSATLQVTANGSTPLFYQWRKEGAALAGANGAVLTLPGILPAQAGNYDVVITNAVGTVTSAVATLKVQRVVQVQGTNVATGNPVNVPVTFLGAGDENGIGFTLRFDPSLLSVAQVTNAAGITNAALNVNTNQVTAGLLGIALAQPAGQTFTLGTQQVAVVRFVATTNPGTASLTFADAPVVRSVANANADSLDTVFVGDTIITALVPPTITLQPLPRQVDPGQIVGFGVGASGSLPMFYQWQKNGAVIAGATNSLYLISSPQVSDSGSYAARVQNAAGAAYSSNAVLAVIPPDTNGPTLSSARYGSAPLVNGMVLSNTDSLSVSATDPSGVSGAQFLIDGNLLASVNGAAGPYSALWSLESATDGPHTVIIKATDMRNNATTITNQVVVALAAPPAPVIGLPVSGAIVSDFLINVLGAGPKNSSVVLYRNGARVGSSVPVPLTLAFQTTLSLQAGTNQIQAVAFNRAGEGPRSAAVIVVLDNSIPQPPNGVVATAKSGGQVQVQWLAAATPVKGYNLYRSTTPFTNASPDLRLNGLPLSQTTLLDTPWPDAKYYYHVSTVGLGGTEGPLSTEATAISDSAPPEATSITYVTDGAYDSVTGRYGQGIMTATVTMSEPVQAIPFLSITPSNGLPILVNLNSLGSNAFSGSFAVTEATPYGPAVAVLSARDLVGNRGTFIRSGGSLFFDTAGPEVQKLAIQPAGPILNNSTNPVRISFTAVLSEPVMSNTLPQFTWTLSKTGTNDLPTSALSAGTNNLIWIGSFTLPATAGQVAETLTMNFDAQDALGNEGSTILPPHQLDVYQGALPPLDAPAALTAKSKPAGAIALSWQAVTAAADYQLYRKGVLESSFSPVTLTAGLLTNLDTPPSDGRYDYVVVSVRRQNGQQALSAFSNPAEAQSDRVPPNPPLSLVITQAANGSFLKWAPSSSSEPVTYNLYRGPSASVTNLAGAAPLIPGIPIAQVVDTSPAPWEPYYVVAAVDAVGNVSAASPSAFLNLQLLPVRALAVSQTDSNAPVVTWTQTGNTIVGQILYLGEDGSWVRMNPGRLITSGQFIDTGYTGDARRYTVASVDNNQQQSIGRSIRLPKVSFSLDTNAVVKRGLMNLLTFAVTNNSTFDLAGAQMNVGVDGSNHVSEPFDLAAGTGTNVGVVVPGYSDLPDPVAQLAVSFELQAEAGEQVSITRNVTVPTADGQLFIGVMASDLVKGAPATLQFSLLNPGAQEIEVITASGGGSQPSPDVRFRLLDLDGAILATVPVQTSIGDHIVNLPNGNAVLRLPAGAQTISDPVTVTIPANVAGRVVVRVEIDKVYYHSGQPDAVVMNGVQTGQEFPVIDTSYYGQVTSASPSTSNGDQPVTISGMAWYRVNHQPAGNVPLVIKISNSGFQRSLETLTAADGTFSTNFTALAGEAGGIYNVWAVHPDLSDTAVQATFAIERVLVSPSQFGIRAPYYYTQPVPLTLTPGPGTTATNVHVEFRPQDQPGGALPAGIAVGLGTPIPSLSYGQTATITVSLTGNPSAPANGSLVLCVTSDDAGTNGWQKIPVSFQFSEAHPLLSWTPNAVDTGVAPSDNPTNAVVETVSLSNVGVVAATNLTFSLVSQDGSAAPAWALLTSQTNLAQLAVGDNFSLGLQFQPPPSTAEGDYYMKLRIRSQNTPDVDLFVHVAVANSGVGNVQFKIVDMYTSTNFVDGVTNALVTLQNQKVQSLQTNLLTDIHGECVFTGLPAGLYQYQVTADKHNSSSGSFWVRAGITVNQQVALNYSLVSVTWDVVPITIQDTYDIVLNAVFETDVPAPVVTLDPAAINLPQMFAGDIYLGEFSIQNHGLIRADNLTFSLPVSDDYFTYEAMVGAPDHLDANQTVIIPYRITCKQDMPGPNQRPTNSVSTAGTGLGTKAGKKGFDNPNCVTYQERIYGAYQYKCINGILFRSGFDGIIGYTWVKDCPGGPSAGSWFVWGGGGGGGGPTYAKPSPPPRAPECFPWICPPSQPHSADQCQSEQAASSACSSPCRECTGASWVSLVNREYQDELEDLSLRVPGGAVKVLRQFYQNTWHWVDIDRRLVFQQGAQGISSIQTRLLTYLPVNTARTVFQYLTFVIKQTSGGWLWQSTDGQWEAYDQNGRLLSSGKWNLTLANYVYDNSGTLVAVTDGGGRALFNYSYAGNAPSAVSDFTGRRVAYTWNGGNLTAVRDVMGLDTLYQYDATGRITQKTDVNGNVTSIAYDGGGYVYSVLDAQGNGKFFTYSYDQNARQYYSLVRTSGGQVKERRFDANGIVVSKTDNGIPTSTFLRDGRTEQETSASGAITWREYDEFGYMTKETKPDGGVTTWDYDPAFKKPIRKVDPLGAVTLMAYDSGGTLTTQIDAAGTISARTNSWVCDTNNLLVLRVDARGNRMQYAYDAWGNLLREFDPDNPAYQTTYTYDARGNRIAVTNALGNATLYGYDAQNRLVAETNALGYVTLYTYQGKNLAQVETGRDGANQGRIVRYYYDGHGRLTQTARLDAQGQEHVWETTTYDGDGRQIGTANALGQTTRYEYNALGQQSVVHRPYSATETSDTQSVYDTAGRLFQQFDPLGVVTQYEYDSLDRAATTIEALGTPVQRSRQRGYDLTGNLTSITYSDGTNTFTTFYDYDLLNRRVAIRGAREYPKQFQYDANDNQVLVINGRGYGTEHGYDQYNRLTNTVEGIANGDPGEHGGSSVFDLVGDLVSSFDGNWNHRHYHYDALGRRTEESIPFAPNSASPAENWWTDNSVVLKRTWYNQWGQSVATSNTVGGVTSTLYDSFGRQFTHTDAAGLCLTNEYNENDQLLAIHYPVVSTAPLGSPPTSVRYAYDAYNAQILVSTADRANLTTRHAFDKRYQRISELTSSGALTTYRYDELGRQTGMTNPLIEVKQSVFDQFGQLVATIYADNIPATQERIEYRAYDEFGKITNHWGAATYDISYTYDQAGNQISVTDGKGNATRWKYDARNRILRKIYADGSGYESAFDRNGNLLFKRDPSGKMTHYEYSAYNLPVSVTFSNDPNVTIHYDAIGRRVGMIDGSGTNTWIYDTAGNILSNVQYNVNYTVNYNYDIEGNRLSMSCVSLDGSGGLMTTYTYDYASRLEAVADRAGVQSVYRYFWETNSHRLASLTYPSGCIVNYNYDSLGRKTVLSITDAALNPIQHIQYTYDKAGQRIGEATLGHNERFSYDAKRQLISSLRLDSNGAADVTWAYTFAYDPIGNRTVAAAPGNSESYTANALNEYTIITNSTSNILGYDPNGNMITDKQTTYRYDDSDHLLSTTNNFLSATYAYDGLGRRVYLQFSGQEGTQTARFVYDGALVVGRLVQETGHSSWICRGLDLGLTRQAMGGVGGILSLRLPGTLWEVFNDGNGNVRMYHSADEGILHEIDYDPFGSVLVLNGSEQLFGFASKELLVGGQLLDFGSRVYRPELGRWLTRDPLGENASANLYAYARNDPIDRVDPDGRVDVKTVSNYKTDCSEAAAQWQFTPENTLGCNGWIVQHVTVSVGHQNCPRPCASGSDAFYSCATDFYEAWPIQGNDPYNPHPFSVSIGAPGFQNPKFTYDSSKYEVPGNTIGSYTASGEIRFICADLTKDDPPEKWPQGTFGCGISSFGAVAHVPSWWGSATWESPGYRLNQVNWSCCKCKHDFSHLVLP